MEIGEKIKKRREELHMSQQELAEKVGYTSRSTINKIECGANNLRQTKISQIAKALDTTPAYLMGWSVELDAVDTDVLVEKLTNKAESCEYDLLVNDLLIEINKLNTKDKEHLLQYVRFLNSKAED